MKATSTIPAFLRVEKLPSYNKHLPKPFVLGELVKVKLQQNPQTEQHPDCKMNLNVFKKNYVKIIRKTNTGWDKECSESWSLFEILKTVK